MVINYLNCFWLASSSDLPSQTGMLAIWPDRYAIHVLTPVRFSRGRMNQRVRRASQLFTDLSCWCHWRGGGGRSQLNPSHEASLVQDVVGCVCARFVAAALVSCQEDHTLLPIVNFDEDDYNGHCDAPLALSVFSGRSPGNRDSLPGDAEKRLREEDLGEVRTDVAHVSKRKKMVSSVQLTLQDPHQQSGGVITNSVLRELEDRTGDPAPAHRYTEITNNECRENIAEQKVVHNLNRYPFKLEDKQLDLNFRISGDLPVPPHWLDQVTNMPQDSVYGTQETPQQKHPMTEPEAVVELPITKKEVNHVDRELPHTIPVLDSAPEWETTKSGADIIGGSGYVSVTPDKGTKPLVSEQEANKEESVVDSGVSPQEGLVLFDEGSVKASSSVASILDLQDVEYADADAEDSEDDADSREDKGYTQQTEQKHQVLEELSVSSTLVGSFAPTPIVRLEEQSPPPSLTPSLTKSMDGPDTMTPDEAENLLSSRQESLLSDEEAQEVVRLLSPTEDKEPEDPEWLADVLSVTSDSLIQESTLDYRSRSELSVTMEDSMTSSHIGSQTGSESGLLGSVSSLNDQEGDGHRFDTDFAPPQPGKVVIIENGVHYFEDGHFWMEVPGLPESDDEEELDYPMPVKKNTKVTFSTGPIKVSAQYYGATCLKTIRRMSGLELAVNVFSTFSVNDYDRRNEDVDPVAASAEYELEKRVEKMEVFPVELTKGPEGLGLSMGVGADAGLEKLGIFVKTITDQGAAAKDSRIQVTIRPRIQTQVQFLLIPPLISSTLGKILLPLDESCGFQVNDQIIEVDGKSLVGVTQAYAASVLRNTCGLVKFLIGRERDPENSEVAQLIKQSLQADRERAEQRHQMELQNQVLLPRSKLQHSVEPGSLSPDSSMTLPLTGTSPTTSSSSEGPASPPDNNSSVGMSEQEPMSPSASDADSIRTLLQELSEIEQNGADKEEMVEKLRQASMKLREAERNMHATKKDVSSYQDMLEQSQGQYIALEKKYGKAKKLLREFQQREQDLLHREEFHLQLLQEKDTEYNALVKTLKDRVIQLEQELLETQRKAGLPAVLPYDSTSLRQLTPQLSRRHQALPAKPLLQQLETELSDTEISDISPEDGDKTATVERKMPVKEELDRAVPPHELLDVSASKAKAELATRGGLAGRHLPSGKKTAGSGGLSSSGSDYTLDESCDNSGDEDQDRRHLYIEYVGREELATSTEVRTQNLANAQSQPQVANRPTSLSPSGSTYSNVISSSSPTSHVHTLVSQFTSAQQKQQQSAPVPQYSAVVKQHTHFQSPQPLYSHVSPGPQPLHVHPHPHHVDPWAPRPPASLAEQLKQVLAERERRISGGEQASSQGDLTEMDKGVSQRLVEEIRQAVSEANMRVKKVNPQTLLPPTTQTPWQPQSSPLRDMGPPSPSVSSSGSVSPGVPTADPSPSRPIPADTGDIWLPPHPQDLNSSYSSEKKSSHFWQSAPVVDWSVEQVCQWLLALGLEQHTPKFRDQQVAGVILLQLESRDFKQLGVNGDDKNRLKRKLKELRVQVEKERRQLEKERKEKERLQKKAEKLAEKASKRK
uniref:Neurabin-1 n=1 Tax=Timema cristinae TaxID=61476 RepID=A0A7R9H2M6_TIMCR|nr:unnamed protein product [Timema cristinae]